MLGLRPFQVVLLAVFGVLAVGSIMLLSNFSPSGTQEEKAYGNSVVIWGTLNQSAFSSVINNVGNGDKGFKVVSYKYIDPRSFDSELVNAIAEGRSPDLIVLPHSKIVMHRSKLYAIPYATISERTFRDTYVDGAEIFALVDGIYAIPFAVDPMVLYWNRDIFSSNSFAEAPTTWEYITTTLVPALTTRDNNRTILSSALAFGEFRNILHAKEMLVMLAMQAGSKLVYEERNRYVVGLDASLSGENKPLTSSVQFFTDFSNSNSRLYSWNRVQADDRNAFVASDLAMYFGYGSERNLISDQNPNLNFDMAPMPQGASATIRRTYGEFYGFAIPKASPNGQGAYLVAQRLAAPATAALLAEQLSIAPVARSAIAVGHSDPYRQVMFNAALVARGWLDPGPEASNGIFQTMIEDITSGRLKVNEAVRDAEQRVQLAF